MLNALYTIIIYPLYQIVELAYRVFSVVSANTGIAIIGVSVTVTLLCLPLYNVAEMWQEKERLLQKKMKGDIDHIKKAFSGDEQYMLLSTFYRENHYSPIMQLRQSFGLLIQIPFFIAAYQFMSHNGDLVGESILFIKDLGKPDSLLKIGNFGINILPIAMTIINIVSGIIYSKGHGIREKVQIFGMALVFLVVLYNSPAGLVFYWTMNNVFSLVKNVFYKLKNPLKIFHICCCVVLTSATIYLLVKRFNQAYFFVFASIVLIFLPIIIKYCKKIFSKPLNALSQNNGVTLSVFLVSAIALSFLCGIVIPSFLMTSSISEYCYLEGYNNPLYFLYNSFLQAIGFFVFWPVCIYFLFNKKTKASMAFLFFVILISGLVNNFIFQGDYGTVLPEVEFVEHKPFIPNLKDFLINTSALLAIFVSIYFLFKFSRYKIISFISSTVILCMVVLSVVNISRIGIFYKNYEKPPLQLTKTDQFINLSKTQKNVIVIMVDGATGYMVNDVFENRPELYEQFDGFVQHPNCVSFGCWTIQGALPLYGGYEYTPWSMNHRRETTMRDKHNEGISLQANVFSHNGYTCTVMDPPYPNYDEPPVFKAFENLPNTKAYQTFGRYNDIWCAEHNVTLVNLRSYMIKRNFILFSAFKIAPMIVRPFIVHRDFWVSNKKSSDGRDLKRFLDNYSILDYLPRFTNFENENPCFVIMDNEMLHDKVFVQLPDFTPAKVVDNSAYEGKNPLFDDMEFHVTSAAYILLGKYFEYLKENGVYDNTRIIITADHGCPNRRKNLFDDTIGPYPFERFNPVLMVKDFGQHGKISTDIKFMTNADVPALAFENLIKNPTNPWTKKPILPLTTEEKNKNTVISFSEAHSVLTQKNNGFVIKDKEWFTVHDSIFKAENWKHEMPKD